MTNEMIWNLLLTFGFGAVGWLVKGYADEMKRISILLNKTREEAARDYVTKYELHADVGRVLTRIDAMDAKIERLLDRLLT